MAKPERLSIIYLSIYLPMYHHHLFYLLSIIYLRSTFKNTCISLFLTYQQRNVEDMFMCLAGHRVHVMPILKEDAYFRILKVGRHSRKRR